MSSTGIAKRYALCCLLVASCAVDASADLPNPSTLAIKEIRPSEFSVVLTLPVVNGKIASFKPILPDVCRVDPDPIVSGNNVKSVRTWAMECDPSLLAGAPIGIQGLLGTATNVLLTIETLDGRKHTRQLRATQSYFVVPSPPSFLELVRISVLEGLRRYVGYLEIALLILVLALSTNRRRSLLIAIAVFALAQGVGQYIAEQRWMLVSPFLPRVIAAALVGFLGLESMDRTNLRFGWWRPLPLLLTMLGLLYGAARFATISTDGLSIAEQSFAMALFAVGAFAGLLLLTVAAYQWKAILNGLPEPIRDRWAYRGMFVCVGLAAGIVFYRAATPLFGGGFDPTVSLIALSSFTALGYWYGRDYGGDGWLIGGVTASFYAAGIIVSRFGTIPYSSVLVFGLPALIGSRLLTGKAWPKTPTLWIVGLTVFFQGYFLGRSFAYDPKSIVSSAIGAAVVATLVFQFSCRAIPIGGKRGRVIARILGILIIGVAAAYRFVDYRIWVNGPAALDLATGNLRVPILAFILLISAFAAWPRRRKFDDGAGGTVSRGHWYLLGLAFFTISIGTLRIDIPFHTPGAPSAAEAGRILDVLLNDTYVAFNLADENDTFDRLAKNLSHELVADVYLDSRRRLAAGTREGAEVTVRAVDLVEIDEGSMIDSGDYTYPCRWVVTARVRHLQHVHDRRNAYMGYLTIRIEDDRWKISALELVEEEQTVLSRGSV